MTELTPLQATELFEGFSKGMEHLADVIRKCNKDHDAVEKEFSDYKITFQYEATGLEAYLLKMLNDLTKYNDDPRVYNSLYHEIFAIGIVEAHRKTSEKFASMGELKNLLEKIIGMGKETKDENLH